MPDWDPSTTGPGSVGPFSSVPGRGLI